MHETVRMISPWVNFYKEIEALFGEDPDINIIFDNDNMKINLYVEKQEKAEALSQLLPDERVFGNITVKVAVIPANFQYVPTIKLFEDAFENNPVFSYANSIEGLFSNPINYVVFKNKVVQYYNDDLGDANGVRSTLYQEIAKDVFGDGINVNFCTDVKE